MITTILTFSMCVTVTMALIVLLKATKVIGRASSISLLIAVIILMLILLYIMSIGESQRKEEFDHWARVNKIKYTNGRTNLKVSEWKTYQSLMHGPVQYREILE
jgi:uncharacterized membrane protein